MMNHNLPSIQAIRKARCERSLAEYTKDAWKVLEPMTPYKHNWHVDAICEYLQAVKDGQITRLLINMPPRMLKSMLVTIMFPTWMWIHEPHKKFINLSYASSLSKEHNIKKRDLVESHWYQENWGDIVQLKRDVNTQTLFENTATGTSFSTSVGGTLTGKGADVIIFDDPHSPSQAESDADRENAVNFFKGTLQTRLNNPVTGSVIVVMQRLHDQDVSGHILSKGLNYEHLCLPMTADERQIISLPSGKQIIREAGSLLQPDRYDEAQLQDLKDSMGSYSYSGQYQQEPTPKGGGTFKRHWWRYWQPEGYDLDPVKTYYVDEKGKKHNILIKPVTIPDKMDETSQSWDLAFKAGKENDNVACGIWGKRNANKYMLHLDMKKRTFTETLAAIRSMSKAYPDAKRKLVEDKANGPAVIDTLKDEITGMIPINPGSDSKEARAESVTPQIESGNVYLPHPDLYKWVEPFIENCAKFPRVAHDDDVDQMVQQLIYWNKKKKFRSDVI